MEIKKRVKLHILMMIKDITYGAIEVSLHLFISVNIYLSVNRLNGLISLLYEEF